LSEMKSLENYSEENIIEIGPKYQKKFNFFEHFSKFEDMFVALDGIISQSSLLFSSFYITREELLTPNWELKLNNGQNTLQSKNPQNNQNSSKNSLFEQLNHIKSHNIDYGRVLVSIDSLQSSMTILLSGLQTIFDHYHRPDYFRFHNNQISSQMSSPKLSSLQEITIDSIRQSLDYPPLSPFTTLYNTLLSTNSSLKSLTQSLMALSGGVSGFLNLFSHKPLLQIPQQLAKKGDIFTELNFLQEKISTATNLLPHSDKITSIALRNSHDPTPLINREVHMYLPLDDYNQGRTRYFTDTNNNTSYNSPIPYPPSLLINNVGAAPTIYSTTATSMALFTPNVTNFSFLTNLTTSSAPLFTQNSSSPYESKYNPSYPPHLRWGLTVTLRDAIVEAQSQTQFSNFSMFFHQATNTIIQQLKSQATSQFDAKNALLHVVSMMSGKNGKKGDKKDKINGFDKKIDKMGKEELLLLDICLIVSPMPGII